MKDEKMRYCLICKGDGVIRESIERPLAGKIEVLCPCRRKVYDPEYEREVRRDFERIGQEGGGNEK